MIKRLLFIFTCGWLLSMDMLVTPVLAVVVPHLYTAQIPVASEATDNENNLIAQALQQVLIKVSGNSGINQLEIIKTALPQASNYVEQFTFQSAPSNAPQPFILQASFPANTINDLLQKAGQPIWSKDRPLVLAWIALQDNKGTQLVGSEDNSELAGDLMSDAQNRGLPFLLPLLDLTDLQQINTSAVTTGNLPLIQQVSARYSPDILVLGQVNATDPQQIQSTWTIIANNQQQQWQIKGNSLNNAAQNAINKLTDTLAKQYAVLENNSANTQITLNVTNLQSVNDYAQVLKYLRSLNIITDVEVANVSPNEASFNLQLQGSIDDLEKTIALGGMLQLQPANDEEANAQTLNYQLISNNAS